MNSEIRARVVGALLSALGLLPIGCSAPEAPDAPDTACVASGDRHGVEQAALNGGSNVSHYLALSALEAASAVRVRDSVTGTACTGSIVAARWILSAAHCAGADGTLEVARRNPDTGTVDVMPVVGVTIHDTLDLMLLEVEEPGFENAAALAVATELPAAVTGQLVEIAGFAVDEDGNPVPAFAVETVVAQDDDSLTVSADGYAGACTGDSGGALLSRSASGGVEIWGVLSGGSVSCWGEDRYQRTDAARDWFGDQLGAEASPEQGCGGLGLSGRCFGHRAAWCELDADGNEQVAGAECDGDRLCGWDPDEGGFRCVSAESDPCAGRSDLGACEEGDAVRCIDGALRRNPCLQCGAACARSPETGAAVCVPNADTTL